jgi:hypothetical protein
MYKTQANKDLGVLKQQLNAELAIADKRHL